MDGFEDAALAPPVRPTLTYPQGDPPAPGTVKQVAEGVLWVRMPMPMGLDHINLWLIEDGPGWALVDTGLALDETRAYWRTIFTEALGGKPITRVLVTHMHPDHVGLAGWISRKFSAPLHMTRLEYMTCRVLVADTLRDAPEEGVRFFRAAGWSEDDLDSYRVKFGGFGKAVSRLPDSFVRLTDGDEITIGAHSWRVIGGNGHSPEHACLWQPDLKLLISGDQVLPRISSNVSVFPTEPSADPLSDWLASCAKLRAALPADTLTLPAHNEPFIGLHERLNHLIVGHERGMDRLEKRLREGPRRVVDLFTALFARKISGDDFGMATGETLAHLNCLIGRGRVRKRTDATGIDFYESA